MERLWEYMPLMTIYICFIGSIAVRSLIPPPVGEYAALGMLISPIVIIFVQNFAVMLKYCSYNCLEAVVRSGRAKRVKFFFKSYSSTIVEKPDRLLTTLHIMKWKHGEYGKVDKIYILHDRAWEDRYMPTQQTIYVEGFSFTHPNVDYAELWELEEPIVEYGQPYPVYWLALIGGDHGSTKALSRYEVESRSPEAFMKRIEMLEAEVARYKAEVALLKEQNISHELLIGQQSSEIRGLLKGKQNIMDYARKVVADAAARTANIQHAAEQLGVGRGPPWVLLSVVALIGVFIAACAVNPELTSRITEFLNVRENQLFLLAFAFIAVLGVYVVSRRGRR